MLDLHPKYQVDERGKRVVVLSEEEYESLLAWAEVNSPDPDEGLKLRPEFEVELHEQMERIARGNDKSIPWNQVKREFDLE